MSAEQLKETGKSQPATETAKDVGPDDEALGDQKLDTVIGGLTFAEAKKLTIQRLKESE